MPTPSFRATLLVPLVQLSANALLTLSAGPRPAQIFPGAFRALQTDAQAPKTTRVPVDGITSVLGIAMCTAMIVFIPVQCMGTM